MSIGSGSGRHASSGSNTISTNHCRFLRWKITPEELEDASDERQVRSGRCKFLMQPCYYVSAFQRSYSFTRGELGSHLKWSVIYSILPHTPLCGMPCLRLPHSGTRLPHSLLRAESLPKPSAKSALRFYQRWNRSGATTTV